MRLDRDGVRAVIHEPRSVRAERVIHDRRKRCAAEAARGVENLEHLAVGWQEAVVLSRVTVPPLIPTSKTSLTVLLGRQGETAVLHVHVGVGLVIVQFPPLVVVALTVV